MNTETFEQAYLTAIKSWTPEKLRHERDGLSGHAPKLAEACAAELAVRGLPQEAPPTNDKPGLHMRPSSTIDGRSAIDLWRGDEMVGTIYCAPGGLHIAFEPGYATGPLEIDRTPPGLTITVDKVKA